MRAYVVTKLMRALNQLAIVYFANKVMEISGVL